jgi:hypothetical protein
MMWNDFGLKNEIACSKRTVQNNRNYGTGKNQKTTIEATPHKVPWIPCAAWDPATRCAASHSTPTLFADALLNCDSVMEEFPCAA